MPSSRKNLFGFTFKFTPVNVSIFLVLIAVSVFLGVYIYNKYKTTDSQTPSKRSWRGPFKLGFQSVSRFGDTTTTQTFDEFIDYLLKKYIDDTHPNGRIRKYTGNSSLIKALYTYQIKKDLKRICSGTFNENTSSQYRSKDLRDIMNSQTIPSQNVILNAIRTDFKNIVEYVYAVVSLFTGVMAFEYNVSSFFNEFLSNKIVEGPPYIQNSTVLYIFCYLFNLNYPSVDTANKIITPFSFSFISPNSLIGLIYNGTQDVTVLSANESIDPKPFIFTANTTLFTYTPPSGQKFKSVILGFIGSDNGQNVGINTDSDLDTYFASANKITLSIIGTDNKGNPINNTATNYVAIPTNRAEPNYIFIVPVLFYPITINSLTVSLEVTPNSSVTISRLELPLFTLLPGDTLNVTESC